MYVVPAGNENNTLDNKLDGHVYLYTCALRQGFSAFVPIIYSGDQYIMDL